MNLEALFVHPFFEESIYVLRQLVVDYGLVGLLVSSFLGSTIFLPFPVEVVFPVLRAVDVSSVVIVFVATIGSVAGLHLNYWLGYRSIQYLGKKIKKKRGQKAKKIIEDYGDVGLFFIVAFPTPIPADPVAVIAGMGEMDLQKFVIITAVGKFIRYGVTLGLINLFM